MLKSCWCANGFCADDDLVDKHGIKDVNAVVPVGMVNKEVQTLESSFANLAVSVGTKSEARTSFRVQEDLFQVEVHGADLTRSFTRVGAMSPYCVIIVDGKEVKRSESATRANKAPRWGVKCTASQVPKQLTISVWNPRSLRSDVFCGDVTIPCSADMGNMESQTFAITKRSKRTGSIRVTLVANSTEPVRDAVAARKREESDFSAGMEFDALVKGTELGGQDVPIVLKEGQYQPPSEAGSDSECPTLSTAHGPSGLSTNTRPFSDEEAGDTGDSATAKALLGYWTCVSTFGLEDFLKATGVGMFQRNLALAARWPNWEYKPGSDNNGIHFINHSAIGDLKEDIMLGSKEYKWTDGHGNVLSCHAEWKPTPNGGVLTLRRHGKLGPKVDTYTEERVVDGNSLSFTLTHSSGVVWGRKFERKVK